MAILCGSSGTFEVVFLSLNCSFIGSLFAHSPTCCLCSALVAADSKQRYRLREDQGLRYLPLLIEASHLSHPPHFSSDCTT